MKNKFLILLFPMWCISFITNAQNSDEIEMILTNHNWTLLDNNQIKQNKTILDSYKLVFTNAKGYWRPGYRIHLKNNGELTAGSYPLCGTGPQVWSSLSGYWEVKNEDTIVFHYTENEIHYMNMEPPSEENKVKFKTRIEVYKFDLINNQYIGLNPIY